MILGFQPKFVKPILDGTKIHTFRLDAKRRWHAGNTIQFYTGVRTKDAKKFRPNGLCYGVQVVTIKLTDDKTDIEKIVLGNTLTIVQKIINPHVFARQDGFASTYEMAKFMAELYSGEFGVTIPGVIIHWTDYLYA